MDLHKIIGQLGAVAEELDSMDEKELHATVVNAESAMKKVKEELEANPDYQEAKENVKALSAGKKDLDRYQKAKIQYSLYRLEELGKLGDADRALFNIKKLGLEAKKAAKDLAAMGATVTLHTANESEDDNG